MLGIGEESCFTMSSGIPGTFMSGMDTGTGNMVMDVTTTVILVSLCCWCLVRRADSFLRAPPCIITLFGSLGDNVRLL
jgi:hypothetical protein